MRYRVESNTPFVWRLLGLAVALAVALVAGCGQQASPTAERPARNEGAGKLSLTTAAFQRDASIPTQYTCDGQNISPALSWSGVPGGTRAFALIVDDPDAPRGVFTHWVLFNLPADARQLPENVAKTERLDSGAAQGRNDAGRTGYTGPCPPLGAPHRYRFTLYALDSLVSLEPGASKQDLLKAMEGHVLEHAQLVGTYGR